MRISTEVQIASLAFILAAAGGATPRQEARTQPLEPDESLWIMTEVRRQPLEPERIGEPRRIPLVVPGVSDWMNTGDAWVAKGKTSTAAIVGTDRLIVEEYYISSERTNDGPNRIYCAIARPELASNPVPVVLIFHGGGGHASPALALAAARRHPGMAGLAMDYNGQFAPGGGPHVTQWQNVSREQNLNLVPDLRNWRMYHYVIAARRTIDFLETLPWADAHRVGCVGVSYGGWVALILAGVDERVRCVTTGVSAGGVGDIPSKAAQPMRWDPPEQRALWLANYEPLAHAPKTQAGVFLQLASNDYWFWITGAARQLAALPGPKGWVIRPNSNHGAGGPEISDLAAPAFMRHVLLGAPGLPAVTHLASSEQGERFTWRISGPRPVTRTALYWSPGNAGSSARYWIELPAALVGDFWEARVPPDLASLAAQAFVNVLTDDGLAVTSALVVRTGIDPLTTPDEPNGVRLWGLGLANVLNDPSGTRRAVAGSVTASASSLHSLRSLRSGGVRPRRRRPVCEVSHTKWRSWNPRHRPRSLRSRRGDRRNLARRGPRSAHRLPEQPNGVRLWGLGLTSGYGWRRLRPRWRANSGSKRRTGSTMC